MGDFGSISSGGIGTSNPKDNSRSAMQKVILVVDDEAVIRTSVREILEDEGFGVKEAATADEALLHLEGNGISLVLTDIEMPGRFNGLELARMIRAMWPTIAVVVTSGKTLPRSAELPPYTPMLTKPFSPERLLSVVRAAA
jgi:CheY-like chemotaxis protein